jgi:hypothetical protein
MGFASVGGNGVLGVGDDFVGVDLGDGD